MKMSTKNPQLSWEIPPESPNFPWERPWNPPLSMGNPPGAVLHALQLPWHGEVDPGARQDAQELNAELLENTTIFGGFLYPIVRQTHKMFVEIYIYYYYCYQLLSLLVLLL